MPVWLRRFTFNKMQEYYSEKNEAEERQIKKANSEIKKVRRPSYSTRASK